MADSLIGGYFVNKGEKAREKRVIMPFHAEMFDVIDDWFMGNLPGGKRNLAICIPPRHTKTTLARDIAEFGLGLFPDSEWIYTSYSTQLAVDQTVKIRAAVDSDWYREMFKGFHALPPTDGRQDYFRTVFGGSVYGVGAGGSITGFGAGKKRKEFGGAIICFPRNEKVWTERGLLEIGEIVEKRLPIKAYSYNFSSQQIELQTISGWYKNPGSDLVEVAFNDGARLTCTPDHKIWTNNRGWVEAAKLTLNDRLPIVPSDVFNDVKADSEHSTDLCPRIFSVAYNSFLFIRKLVSIFPRMLHSGFRRNLRPCFAGFNLPNNAMNNAISLAQNCGRFVAGSNFDSLFSCELDAGSAFEDRKCPMPFGVGNILTTGSINKVFKAIIGWVAVNMSNFASMWTGTNKSLKNGAMNSHSSYAVASEACKKDKMSACFRFEGENFIGNRERGTVFSDCDSLFASNSSDIGCTITTGSRGDRKPLFVRHVGFSDETYCISIRGNHNFYIGESQAVLVSNCDDPMKADDARSETVRQHVRDWFTGVLLSRRNSDDTPMLLIAQRLHPEDLVGHLKQTMADEWHFLEIPAVIPGTEQTIWPETFSYESAMRLKEIDPFAFYSQYQQEPIVPGGAIIKADWWRYYDDFGAVNKKCDVKIITADTAYGVKDANDYSVFQCWGFEGNQRAYLLDQVRGKWGYEQLVQVACEFWDKHSATDPYNRFKPVYRMYIENKASGQSLVQQFDLFREKGINAFPWNPGQKDKVARVKECLPAIFSGRVILPDTPEASWIDDFLAECSAFSEDMSHSHDDAVDAMAMAILLWRGELGGVSE